MDLGVRPDRGDLGTPEFERVFLRSQAQKLVVRAGHPVLGQASTARQRALEWILPGPHALGPDDGLRRMFGHCRVEPRALKRPALAA